MVSRAQDGNSLTFAVGGDELVCDLRNFTSGRELQDYVMVWARPLGATSVERPEPSFKFQPASEPMRRARKR